jgi:hypothetical protein
VPYPDSAEEETEEEVQKGEEWKFVITPSSY